MKQWLAKFLPLRFFTHATCREQIDAAVNEKLRAKKEKENARLQLCRALAAAAARQGAS